MVKFFAGLYEWFGLSLFFSKDLGELLQGWDITCTGYFGAPLYLYVGWGMIALTSFVYALQYHIIDSSRYNKKQHWWISALVIFVLNYVIAFLIPYNVINAGDYCKELHITTSDCVGFGLSNAIWSFILFLIISTMPLISRLSTNCRHTTFWKP